MSKSIIIVSVGNEPIPIHMPTKTKPMVIVSMAPVPMCPPPIEEIEKMLDQKDNTMRIYDFDKIHLESKKDQIDRRERVRFQNINARIQSKIAQRTYQNKKQKGR